MRIRKKQKKASLFHCSSTVTAKNKHVFSTGHANLDAVGQSVGHTQLRQTPQDRNEDRERYKIERAIPKVPNAGSTVYSEQLRRCHYCPFQQQPLEFCLTGVLALIFTLGLFSAPADSGPTRFLISAAIVMKACSTFVAFLALVSRNGIPS